MAAQKIYASAVLIDPTDPLATYRLGKIFYLQKNYEDAHLMLRKSYSTTPLNAPAAFRDNLKSLLIQCEAKLNGNEQSFE